MCERDLHDILFRTFRKLTLHFNAVLLLKIWSEFLFVPGAEPVSKDHEELLLNKTWRPALSITGQHVLSSVFVMFPLLNGLSCDSFLLFATLQCCTITVGVDGLPDLKSAGNVLRTHTALKLSLRLPPRVDATEAANQLKSILESNPPYGANVTFNPEKAASGWDAPELSPWLEESVERASTAYFRRPANFLGEGGSVRIDILLYFSLSVLFSRLFACLLAILDPLLTNHNLSLVLLLLDSIHGNARKKISQSPICRHRYVIL